MALALTLRLALVAATPHLPLASDPADYVRHAHSIADGDGYPPTAVAGRGGTALRPPGFPFLLGGELWLTGGDLTAARVGQALLGTAIVALTGLLALLLWGPRAGLVALGLAALYPPLIVGGTALVSEPLFTVLVLAAVAALLLSTRGATARWAAAAGVLAGLAVLTRPNGALLVLVLAAGAFAIARGRGAPALRASGLVLACAALVIVPWTARNAVVLHAFVPVSTNGGYTLSGTYNDAARTDPRFPGAWRPANADPAYQRLLAGLGTMTEPQVNGLLGGAARSYMRRHPGYVLEVSGRNLLRLLGLGGREYYRLGTAGDVGLGPRWSDVAFFGGLALLVVAVLGAFTATARRAPLWLWFVPLAMATVVPVIASQRFRIPIDPFLLLLATAAILTAAGRLVRPGGRWEPEQPD